MTALELSYPGQIARAHDPDRFLASMFVRSPNAREAIWTLLAFNHEIAKTREVVSEPQIGLIRLQWWRDAVSEAFAGQPKSHQIVEPLGAYATECHWSEALFERLIVARERDLDNEPLADVPALENYAQETSYPLFMIMAQSLGPFSEQDPWCDYLRRFSIGYALTGILRAMAFYLRDRHVPLPQDLLSQQDMTASRLVDFPHDQRLTPLIRQLAIVAEQHLNAARHGRSAIPKSMVPIFLPAVSASMALKRLKASNYNVFDEGVVAASPLQPIAYSWASLTQRW